MTTPSEVRRSRPVARTRDRRMAGIAEGRSRSKNRPKTDKG